MDERRDPGEFYPGGRVIGRPDLAPPQMQVRWSDILGKPTIPAIDDTLTTAGAAADAKATGDALAARPTKSQLDAGWWSEWSGLPTGVFLQVSSWSDGEWSCKLVDAEGEQLLPTWHITSAVEPESVQVNYGESSFTATRHRVAAPVPTKTSDLMNDSGFLTQHQQLTPVYSQTPTFGEWTFTGASPGAGHHWTLEFLYNEVWTIYSVNDATGVPTYVWGEKIGSPDDTTVVIDFGEVSPFYGEIVTATRVRTDIVGYIPGSQSGKELQPKGAYAPATNISKTALAQDVQTSLGKADTAVQPAALAGAVRYDLPANATAISSASSEVVEGETVTYGEATLADRTANRVAITAAIAELRLAFPAAVSGKVRDFGLRVEVGDGTAALTAPALVPPAGVTLENADGAIPALADGTADAKGVTLLYFSETAPGKFLVKGEEVKEA